MIQATYNTVTLTQADLMQAITDFLRNNNAEGDLLSLTSVTFQNISTDLVTVSPTDTVVCTVVIPIV